MNTTPNEVTVTDRTAGSTTLTSTRGRRSIVRWAGDDKYLVDHESFDPNHNGWFSSHNEIAHGKHAAARAVSLWLGVGITTALLA